MRATPVNLIGGFYTDDSLPWSCQDTVNWLPVLAEQPGTRTVARLRGAPGFVDYVSLGATPQFAIRGAREVEGRLFVVSGNALQEVLANGTHVSRGTIPGVGLVSMTHNQVTNGNQVVVANGSAGYVWNTATNVFVKITDEAFPGAISLDFIDGYVIFVEPFGRFWGHSNLANALDYNGLDRYQAERNTDKIVTARVHANEVVVFGVKSTQFFANTGATTGTFQDKGIVMPTGCASRNTVQEMDNTLIWLGDDGIVYRLESYNAVPISTRSMDVAIAKFNWANAFSYTFEDEGHKVYYLTFPDGPTFGYDAVTKLWTRRESFGLKRWRLNTLVKWQNKWIGGDFQSGRLFQLDWNEFTEAGVPMVAERTSPPTHADQNRITAPFAELLFDTGHGHTEDHEVMLDYSNDGGRNWTNTRRRSLGATGEYRKRVTIFRLGQFRNRVWRIRVSSPCKRDLLGATLQAAAGTS